MAFNRMFSLFSFSKNHERSHSLMDDLKLAPFAILALAPGAGAADIFGELVSNGLNFKIAYEANTFPFLLSQLKQYLNFYSFNSAPSGVTYEYNPDSPECFTGGIPDGRSISLSLQVGKVINEELVDGLTKTMEAACNNKVPPSNPDDPSGPAFLLTLLIIAGVVIVAGTCTGIYFCATRKDSCAESSTNSQSPTSTSSLLPSSSSTNYQSTASSTSGNSSLSWLSDSSHCHGEKHHEPPHHHDTHHEEKSRSTVGWTRTKP